MLMTSVELLLTHPLPSLTARPADCAHILLVTTDKAVLWTWRAKARYLDMTKNKAIAEADSHICWCTHDRGTDCPLSGYGEPSGNGWSACWSCCDCGFDDRPCDYYRETHSTNAPCGQMRNQMGFWAWNTALCTWSGLSCSAAGRVSSMSVTPDCPRPMSPLPFNLHDQMPLVVY